jgi:hypothetical protein
MKKKVLLFHISDAEERKKILKVLLPLKVVVESVGKQDYTQSLDFLSGNKQASKTDEEYAREELEEKMMLFCGMFGESLDRALAALKKEGICRDCLKAVFTTSNGGWNPIQLYEELKKERERLSNRG